MCLKGEPDILPTISQVLLAKKLLVWAGRALKKTGVSLTQLHLTPLWLVSHPLLVLTSN